MFYTLQLEGYVAPKNQFLEPEHALLITVGLSLRREVYNNFGVINLQAGGMSEKNDELHAADESCESLRT